MRTDPTDFNPPKRYRAAFFMSGVGRTRRLDGVEHVVLHRPSKNCVVCYSDNKACRPTVKFCNRCRVNLCHTKARDCFKRFHSPDWDPAAASKEL